MEPLRIREKTGIRRFAGSILGIERTEVECTANGSDDKLKGPKDTHTKQDWAVAVLVEDGVNPDNMGRWRSVVRKLISRSVKSS